MVGKTIGTTENDTDSITTTTVALNATTATKIVDALGLTDQNHIKIYVDNPNNKDIVIKFQAASVDNIAVGLTILKGEGKTILELPNVYRGEISAMTVTGDKTVTILRW